MSQIKTLSITGIKEQSTNSISHIKSINSKKYQNLNFSYNNSFHTINQSKAFFEDSNQIKRSLSHKKRDFKVDIGKIVNEEIDEEGSDDYNEINSEKHNEIKLKPRTKSVVYEGLLRKIESNKEKNENDFKQFLKRFEDEEEFIFDDYMKFDLDDMSVDDFDIDANECYNNVKENCNLLGSNSYSLSKQLENLDNQNQLSDDEEFFENFKHVPTILEKILKQEELGEISSSNEKISSLNIKFSSEEKNSSEKNNSYQKNLSDKESKDKSKNNDF